MPVLSSLLLPLIRNIRDLPICIMSLTSSSVLLFSLCLKADGGSEKQGRILSACIKQIFKQGAHRAPIPLGWIGMIKQCKNCGADINAVANTLYCRSCAESIRKLQFRDHYLRHKGFLIPGQSDRLSEDVHNAIALGISYGVYIGRFKPNKEEHRNAYKRKRII